MKAVKRSTFIALGLLSILWGIALPQTTRVCFTPRFHCASFVTTEIQQAKSQILVQAYFLTSPEILQVLMGQAKAGVQVEILLDRSQKTLERNRGSLLNWWREGADRYETPHCPREGDPDRP